MAASHLGSALFAVEHESKVQSNPGLAHSPSTASIRASRDRGPYAGNSASLRIHDPEPQISMPEPIAHTNNNAQAESEPLPAFSRLAATSSQLESSPPQSPRTGDATEIVQTWRSPAITKWRVLSACLGALGQGFSDSAPGALLPYIEGYYHVDYAVVSTIFVANAVGFIAAAFFVHVLDRTLGRAKTMLMCEAFNVVALAVMVIPPPFAVFVIGYFVIGFSFATTLALNNVFCANVAPATTILGAFHGSYGVGGTVAPLIATAMVTAGIEFSRFYALLLGIRILVAICLGWSFWNWSTEPMLALDDMQLADRSMGPPSAQDVNNHDARTAPRARVSRKKSSNLAAALKNRITPIGALFIFAYQGAEVSISGWVISFLINVRKGDPSRVGYVTAGFWGGITVGRLALSPLAQRMGEKIFTYGLVIGAIAFEVAVWKLQSVVGDSVFIALLGLLLGPVFPCATVVFTRLLPRHAQSSAMAFIASAGSSGGAVAPFITGIAAQSAGTWVLQ